jgi:hypothetical protein
MIDHNRFKTIILSCLILVITSGCAVFMAANQPDEKDVSLFRTGTPRNLLLAEFGMPAASEIRDDKRYDVFQFIQGYSTGAKVGRAAFHGVADVLTIGLWEIVGTPAEAIFDGDKMAYEVSYDDEDKVTNVLVLKAPAETTPTTTGKDECDGQRC